MEVREEVVMAATSVLLMISRPLGWNTPLRFWLSLSNLWISLGRRKAGGEKVEKEEGEDEEEGWGGGGGTLGRPVVPEHTVREHQLVGGVHGGAVPRVPGGRGG